MPPKPKRNKSSQPTPGEDAMDEDLPPYDGGLSG